MLEQIVKITMYATVFPPNFIKGFIKGWKS